MTMGDGITAVVALTMGLRHGLDADHLAVVDSLARQRALNSRTGAVWTGVLFAFGHVAVIFAAAVVLSLTSQSFEPPVWLAATGSVISSATLLVLGALNIHAALGGGGQGAQLAGFRSRLLPADRGARSAWYVLGIGALFAVSFDAVAIAGLFAGAADYLSGAVRAVGLFATGMLAVSAVSGIWVAGVLRDLVNARSGAARVLALTIGIASFTVSVWILAGAFGDRHASLLEISDLSMSLFVTGTVAIGYGAALLLAKRPAPLSRYQDHIRRTSGIIDEGQ